MTLYTRKEIADILNIKPRTIWHWEKKGWIEPLLYVNRRPRYDIESVKKVCSDKNLDK